MKWDKAGKLFVDFTSAVSKNCHETENRRMENTVKGGFLIKSH